MVALVHELSIEPKQLIKDTKRSEEAQNNQMKKRLAIDRVNWTGFDQRGILGAQCLQTTESNPNSYPRMYIELSC